VVEYEFMSALPRSDNAFHHTLRLRRGAVFREHQL
jgi:hypothetical protein